MRASWLDVCFRHRSSSLLLLVFPVVYWTLSARGGASAGEIVAGALCVGSGVVLRLRAIRRIGRGARVARAHASGGLVRSGPYRWSRNPLYLAAALMLGGFGLMAGGGAWAGLLFPAALLAYAPVVVAEEHALREILGEPYQRYLASVPRWLGIPRGGAPEPTEMPVPWSEVLRREKWLVPGCAAGGLAVAALASRPPGVSGLWLGAVWGVAALWNSIHIERKWHRRRRRRELAGRGERPGESDVKQLCARSEDWRVPPFEPGSGPV